MTGGSAKPPIDTRATARIGGLDIEIRHQRSAAGDAERLAISVTAQPSFADWGEAWGRLVAASNPWLYWSRLAALAWAPWLAAAPAATEAAPRLAPPSSPAHPDRD